MKKIKELIVVEGKHDKDRITKLFDCEVLCTGGLGLSEQDLLTIKKASEANGVIVLTDSDYPGRKIRDKIRETCPKAKHAFIAKKDSIGKRNVGVEYAKDECIEEALEKVVTFNEKGESLSWQEYLSFDLINKKNKRDYLCGKLRIGECNNKRLFHYLNMLEISKKEVEEILKDYDSDKK